MQILPCSFFRTANCPQSLLSSENGPSEIERFFGRIKRCRRIATRDEKKPANFAGFL